jgi:ankyrin repeat protein
MGCEHRAPLEKIVMEIDLRQGRRRAKELLRAARAGDPDALGQMRGDRAPRLADAQRVVAVEVGFSSWPALVAYVEAECGDRDARRARLVTAALGGRADLVERLLAHDPGLVDAGLDVALVLGDAQRVAVALDRDPGLAGRELPGVGRKPLSCACHSVFLRPTSPRAPGVRRVVELLLDRGANVNEVHHNEYGAMSVLYGAAGVAHDPTTTRLLLARGADPDDGESVYHAVEADSTECLELLLGEGATVRGTNALGNAIDDSLKVRVLLEWGDLRPADPELRDALLQARAPAVVKLLIEHRASLDVRDPDGLTPYARAARFKSQETMRILEAAGASIELDPAAEWIGAVVRGDDLRAARAEAEHPDLVLRDADLEQLPRWASAGDDEVVTRLLDAGVPVDARGVDGGTGLHFAGLRGRGSTVELLLARGADPEMMSAPGPRLGTPLSWTAWGSRNLPGAAERLDGYLAAARALLAAGAHVTEGMVEVAADELSAELEEAAARTGVLRVTSLSYMPGRPVRIRIRRREHRYDIDDLGAAVAIAGRPRGWRVAAERAVNALGWNINRDGVVSMQAVEGRDIDALAQRTAEASLTAFETLIEIEESHARRGGLATGSKRATDGS